jgi:hypothetical protein
MTGRYAGRAHGEPPPSRGGFAVRPAHVALLAAAVSVVIAVSVAPAVGLRSHRPRAPSGPFGWLLPAPPPAAWSRQVVSSAGATLAYPPGFAPIAGDPGTFSAAVRTTTGSFRAYLNVTPRQGNEELRGFAGFRVDRLAEEHNQSVHEEAAAEGLAFQGGLGSCVLDDYVTRIGHNHYREIACFVIGRHGGAVVVAAAATSTWNRFEPLLRRAVASFAVS